MNWTSYDTFDGFILILYKSYRIRVSSSSYNRLFLALPPKAEEKQEEWEQLSLFD